MSEPIIDEGLWDRVRDNEQHYARLLHSNKKQLDGQFEITISTPDFPHFATSMAELWSWSGTQMFTSKEDIERVLSGGLNYPSMGAILPKTRSLPQEVFFDLEKPIDWAERLKELGLACPHAVGEQGTTGVDGKKEAVFMPFRAFPKPDWSKEILKLQDGTEEIVDLKESIPVSDEMAMHMMGSFLAHASPELRRVSRIVGNEEAVDTVLDALASPYMENLEPLTPEQIAIHNPPVKPVYRIPPRPEPKPRREISKRKSVAKAARQRTKAGRKKNRG